MSRQLVAKDRTKEVAAAPENIVRGAGCDALRAFLVVSVVIFFATQNRHRAGLGRRICIAIGIAIVFLLGQLLTLSETAELLHPASTFGAAVTGGVLMSCHHGLFWGASVGGCLTSVCHHVKVLVPLKHRKWGHTDLPGQSGILGDLNYFCLLDSDLDQLLPAHARNAHQRLYPRPRLSQRTILYVTPTQSHEWPPSQPSLA